jgi:hypothetical protein
MGGVIMIDRRCYENNSLDDLTIRAHSHLYDMGWHQY